MSVALTSCFSCLENIRPRLGMVVHPVLGRHADLRGQLWSTKGVSGQTTLLNREILSQKGVKRKDKKRSLKKRKNFLPYLFHTEEGSHLFLLVMISKDKVKGQY